MRLLLLVTLAAARRLGDLVNLERYPIGDLRSVEGRALVDKARRDLQATGCASFPCFLTAAALSDAVAEATAAAPDAFETDDTHNAYQLSDTDATLLATHVRNQQMRTRVASTACDELDESRAIRALYACDELLGLVKAITGRSVHRLADPLGAASINVFRSGWSHAWHYDESEFTVTLSLVQAAEGGAFEFTEPLRKTLIEAAPSGSASRWAFLPVMALTSPSSSSHAYKARMARLGSSSSQAVDATLVRICLFRTCTGPSFASVESW